MRSEEINDEECRPVSSLISDCCKAAPIGEVTEDAYGRLSGLCSECQFHATFEKDTEDERY